MNYKMPVWANWKKLSVEELAKVDIAAAEREMEAADRENALIFRERAKHKEECILLAKKCWEEDSNTVAYLKRTSIESPPNLRKLLNKYQKAVSDARNKMEARRKGREYRRAKKRREEIDAQIIERYGAGWVEQEG